MPCVRFVYVAVPVAVLNAVVIIATIPEGGHYLIDVIAGAVIAVLSIVIVHGVAGRDSLDSGEGLTTDVGR